MKLFVDTNVMLDLLAHREPFYQDAVRLFSLVDNGQAEAVVAAMSYATCAYLLEGKISGEEIAQMFRQFSSFVGIAAVDERVVRKAISEESRFSDIEDAMQHYAAVQSSCDAIITRNPKDFRNSDLPVFQPHEFLVHFFPKDNL